MEWLDGNKIQIIPPKRPKKLTGTRFATILGLNPWSTPFEIWCEVTRTYQKPFEDTIYTIAGKTIEPKQAEYMKQTYFMSNLVTPTDIWGKDYFRQTYGDFFKESTVRIFMHFVMFPGILIYPFRLVKRAAVISAKINYHKIRLPLTKIIWFCSA